MNRSITSLAVAAALLAAVPAFAHGSHPASNHETRELQEKVNGLNEDVRRDNEALTADERKLIALEMQAAKAKGGQAPPLSIGQQRALTELESRIGNLNKDRPRHFSADLGRGEAEDVAGATGPLAHFQPDCAVRTCLALGVIA